MTVFEEWSKYRVYLLDAIAQTNGTHTEDDVLVGLLHGRLRLWGGERSAIVTEIIVYPRLKAVNCFLGGGDLAELIVMAEQVKAYAKAEGCVRLTAGGRMGWKKIFERAQIGGTFLFLDITDR